MKTRYLFLILAVFLAFHQNGAAACSHPVNPAFSKSFLRDWKPSREYIVAGCADHVPGEGLPLVFAFHGGGERLHDASGSGFLDFTALSKLEAVVVAPRGNPSNNGQSWINAFPWMKPHPADDLELPGALIADLRLRSDLPRIDFGRVFALGKSDGAGMAMNLACHPQTGLTLTGVALVSGAYFGLDALTNFSAADHAICLPGAAVPTILMHGTNDRVMPYRGQNFLNAKAVRRAADYWLSIDPTVTPTHSNTFTADIPRYVESLSSHVFHCAGSEQSALGYSSTRAEGTNCAARFEVITTHGGNHVWPGHALSGPGAGRPPNMDFDATAQIAHFFSIPISR